MAAWHFLKQLTCIVGAHSPTLSRRLIHYSSVVPFLSIHHKNVRYQWLPHFRVNFRSAVTNAKFSAASSSPTIWDTSLTPPAPYTSVLIHCPKDSADMLSEALLSFGASSVSMDQDDVSQSTDEICISSIFPEVEDINISILHAADSIGLKEIPRYEVKIYEEDDWMKRSQFGAAFAVGVDVDSEAIASASQNASLNNIRPDKMQLHLITNKTSSSCKDDSTFGVMERENTYEIQTYCAKFDVVIANILLNPLMDLADQITSYAKPGAVVGLSGVLSEQVQYIIERYSPFLEDIKVSKMDDWACVSGRKRIYMNVR
ncbi:uncharacterized protein LOC124831224 isoform X3 [Vigna umbellata]|uniref:uncharacterized protein LOC124831224 isoform X3 n=1 Tax=Vigna umbellata TaxID=87088 RepID=UPI001F5F9BDC|nr:uncharacterized protein LOC124831224 isoform X3 [Vigna umbellata]